MSSAIRRFLRNKKGFTLIELIVVIAIVGILAAIAIPRFQDIRVASAVKADASTASQIINACRVQETETNAQVTLLTQSTPALAGELLPKYFVVPTPQTHATWVGTLSGGLTANYTIAFQPLPAFAPYNVAQTVTENTKFSISP